MAYFTTNDGCKLFYEEVGSGQPLLLVHGWSQTSRFFKYQLSGLADNFRVIALDLRGHGESEKPEYGLRISRFAADVNDLITQLDLKNVILLGWSMGCSVIWSYLDLFGTSRISKLVLVDEPAWLLNTPEHDLGFMGWDDFQAFSKRVENEQEEFARWFIGIMVTTDLPEEEREWMAQENLKLPSKLATTLVLNHFINDWRDVIKRITLPTLVVAADNGHVRPETQQWIHEQIPGSQLEIFKGRGHLMFYEEPEKFNKLVREFAG